MKLTWMALPLSLLLLAGCASQDSQDAGRGDEAFEPQATRYTCEDGRTFNAYYLPERVVLDLPDGSLSLPQAISASGARYAEGKVEFWTKGAAARLTLPSGFGGEPETVQCQEDVAASIWERAKLSGVDFRAVGNEPGWQLEIRDGRSITLATDYGQTWIVFPASEPEHDRQSGQSIYRVAIPGHQLVVTLSPGPCQDDMSGETFETKTVLELDGKTLRGCGRPLK